MCRLLVYTGHGRPVLLANLLTHPTHSIVAQSYDSKERMRSPLNGDGFGIGWYVLPTATTGAVATGTASDGHNGVTRSVDWHPGIFTSVTPAWNNINLKRLAEKVVSSLVFAHVRAASPGSAANEANCHPFHYKQIMWMHNGEIHQFSSIRRKLLSRLCQPLFDHLQGTTDSEHSFMLFLQHLVDEVGPIEEGDTYTPQQLRTAMQRTIASIEAWCAEAGVFAPHLMNFVVSDGVTVLATRYCSDPDAKPASLYYISGDGWAPYPDRVHDYRMVQQDRRQFCHIIASEPLTKDAKDWVPVPANHMVTITPTADLLLHPIATKEGCGHAAAAVGGAKKDA